MCGFTRFNNIYKEPECEDGWPSAVVFLLWLFLLLMETSDGALAGSTLAAVSFHFTEKIKITSGKMHSLLKA